jgi:prepilin-type N-terminal cleavage/methylation domain-containing protein
MNRLRLRAEGGFTLIELLVVIAIIGILAAIAIPQFAAYRRRGFVAQVQSDVRNIATAEESVFAQTQAYLATVCDSQAAVAACGTTVLGFSGASLGVQVTVVTPSPTAAPVGGVGTFQITGLHAQCGVDRWVYESGTGQVTPNALPGAGICI